MEDDPTTKLLAYSRFWIQRVLVPIVVCIGVGGNFISVIVLTRKKMLCTTTIYLTGLAVADIIYLISVLFLSFEHYPNIHDGSYQFYWSFNAIAHYICDAASSLSVWLTVSFTLERYMVVCHPMKGKILSTERRAKCIIFIVTIMCLLTTFSTLFEYELYVNTNCVPVNCSDNISKPVTDLNSTHVQELLNITNHLEKLSPNKFKIVDKFKYHETNKTEHLNKTVELLNEHFEVTRKMLSSFRNDKTSPCITSKDGNPTDNDDACEENECVVKLGVGTCYTIEYTVGTNHSSLGNNETYKTIFFWFSSLFFGLIPLALIATFNTFLVVAMFKSRRKRRRMTIRSRTESSSQNQENRITILLIAVVILFLVCQTPTAAFLIYDALDPPSGHNTHDNIKKMCGNIFNFLVNLNAALNFVVYCVLSSKFRQTFKELFCARRLEHHDVYGISRLSTRCASQNKKFACRRNASDYVHTPRNLETHSLPSIPRSKSLMARPGKSEVYRI